MPDVKGQLTFNVRDKSSIRQIYAYRRAERISANREFLSLALPQVRGCFADGQELNPKGIRLQLIPVKSRTAEAMIFRLASLLWSIPVSAGFGRRLRYLVWDVTHDRLAGLIALGDPVFNLSVRDEFIGWSAKDRAERLVNLLDAYVLGAVPPYNYLLAGKAVACLLRSREVYEDFKVAYGDRVGVISGKKKRARLLAVTTSSALGRSSVYNRLKLDGVRFFQPIGFTNGWGHFHVSDELFDRLREVLRLTDHPYAENHAYGQGPNWRLRTIRTGLQTIGLDPVLLRHGIQREVFFAPFAGNSIEALNNSSIAPDLSELRSVDDIGALAVERWISPRADRYPNYRTWQRNQIDDMIYNSDKLELRPAA